MPDEANDTRDQSRARLLRAKFGSLLDWRIPGVTPTVGPFDLTPFEEFDALRRDLIAMCEDRLNEYSDAQIDLLLKGRKVAPQDLWQDWRNFHASKIERLRDRSPSWYQAGFGHPDYTAKFDHWCKMPRFSVEEALHLTIGIEPDSFPKQSLAVMSKSPPSTIDGPLGFLLYRYDLLQRTFDPRALEWQVTPRDFLEWAPRVQFETHPEFMRLLKRFHDSGRAKGSPSRPDSKTDQREIDKIAQLFTAMAIDTRGYDPSAARSPIPKEITDLASSMGLQISEDTVRKYLRRGAKFLPEDWKRTND